MTGAVSGAGSGVNDETTRFSSRKHWLWMGRNRRIAGCMCGFVADQEDNGYGDSVVDHIAEVAAAAAVDTALDAVAEQHEATGVVTTGVPPLCPTCRVVAPCRASYALGALRSELREGGSRG